MKTFHRRRAVMGCASAMLLAVAPRPAAAITVFDPTNYAQNLLQAARALEQVQHQVASLQNEAAMLLNQAKHLQRLPYSAWGVLQADMGRVSGLLGEASRIANTV
jgi:P-type conjugative transfer protein TrbJ